MGENVSTTNMQIRQRGSVRLESNVQRFSSFGQDFDNGNAAKARVSARQAMDNAKTPRLYGTTKIDFGTQGTAEIRRVGTEKKGSLQITLNGQNGGSVDYNENGLGMFKKTADDAFKEVKKRLGYRIKI